MKRRLLALLMSIAMCLTLLPSEASAAPEADLWDGTTASGFEGGSGTEQDPYQIASGAQLAYLAALVNSGAPGEKCKDEYFVLTSDLNLNNLEWIPIGKDAVKMLLGESDYSVFAGNFDGNNHTIRNLALGMDTAPTAVNSCGLFGASSGVIKNLTLSTVSVHCTITEVGAS